MSTFSCPVVRVSEVIEHPNADRLSIVKLEGMGFTCISGKLEDGSPRYKVGDFVVYIPSAAVLPEWLLREMDFWNEETGKGMLSGSDGNRVKPLKLRGVFSEGVLYPVGKWIGEAALDPEPDGIVCLRNNPERTKDWVFVRSGDDASSFLGITKWEPPVPIALSGEVANVGASAVNYDFDRWEQNPDIFEDGEEVTVVEKCHGTFLCLQWIPGLNHPEMFGETGNIVVGSKGLIKQGLVFKNNQANNGNVYVQVLRRLLDTGLERNLTALSGSVSNPVKIYGEVFGGSIQDLKYGLTAPTFQVFDVQIGNSFEPRFAAENLCVSMGLTMLPMLYQGPFDLAEIEKVRDGKTTISGDNIREGVVVTSANQTAHPKYGRRIAKFISPDYLTRKAPKGSEATEYQ